MMHPAVREELTRPSGPMHGRMLNFLRPRLQASEKHFSALHPAWREAEQLYRLFRDPDKIDEEVSADSMTEGVQKIVVPYTYATVQSMLAFLISVLTDRKPLFPVEGLRGTDYKAAVLHEHLLEYQLDNMETKGVLVLVQWLLDTLRYGVGVIKNMWTVREWPELTRTVEPVLFQGIPIGMRDTVEEQLTVAYEGNDWLNIQPFRFLPDPSRSFGEFQKGEFCSHQLYRSHTELEQKERQGLYVGVDDIPEHRTPAETGWGGSGTSASGSSLSTITGLEAEPNERVLDAYHRPQKLIEETYAWVRPRDLDVPEEVLPPDNHARLWVFTLANRARVIRAEAANLPGRRFPFAAIEINYDMHSPANPGVVQICRGPQYHLSWLFNSRMANVRRSLNNETLVDPSLIEQTDLDNPNPAGYVRLSKAAWGAGMLDQALKPFPVVDYTANHLNDARTVADMIEQVTGANRLLQGLPNTGRRAATEVQAQLSLSGGRMKLLALLVSAQGLVPILEQMVRNNQIFFDQRLTVRVHSPYDALVGEFAELTPSLLQGFFRIPLLEAGMPSDKAFTANVLREVLGLGMQTGTATVAQRINFDEIFAELMRVLGKKNVADFFTQAPPVQVAAPPGVEVLPDETVQQRLQQGSLVPVDGFPLPPAAATPGVGGNGTQPLV